jgi:hypothetical protein
MRAPIEGVDTATGGAETTGIDAEDMKASPAVSAKAQSLPEKR